MSIALPHVPFAPHPRVLGRAVAVVMVAIALAACGTMEYSFNEKNLFSSPRKEKNISVIHFHFAGDAEPYEVRVRRIKGGYAMQAPLYENADGSVVNFTTSRTSKLDSFIGIEGRFRF